MKPAGSQDKPRVSLFSDEEVARIVAGAPPWDDGPDTSAFERLAIDLRFERARSAALEAALREIVEFLKPRSAMADLRSGGDASFLYRRARSLLRDTPPKGAAE